MNESLSIAEGRNPERVRQALSSCRSFADLSRLGVLFHGTCEAIEGEIRGGAYDGVFWTARTPSVAQAYIPRAGVRTTISATDGYRRDDAIRPSRGENPVTLWALERAGVTLDDLDVSWDGLRAWSWRIPPGWPTLGDLDDHIRALGYEPDATGMFDVSLRYRDGGSRIMPADWRLPGQLLILLPEGLEIRHPEWSEEALGYSAHNRVGDFCRFADEGYAAFRMSDLLQSEANGNVGHEAIGLLPAGIGRVSWLAIPAFRNDGEDLSVFRRPETPELVAFMRSINPEYRAADGEPAAPFPADPFDAEAPAASPDTDPAP
ncbi:hypothetical protein [Defluviimonas salinarum]|uniref:RES domain-containing protein n=1 Tax=Defluviimonas salinarum TaxID=2992147 RepID=A0ABT3J9D3_9RHOB|nr:hypothetical protein [Defluviimonas salinarum]MCW3784307.1 hypothetical protein [Defluviimonas salinarum]